MPDNSDNNSDNLLNKIKDGGNIQIKVDDFGPISTGTIDIKPLTILIGPNNSGKSYAAMLVKSIVDASKGKFHDDGYMQSQFPSFWGIRAREEDKYKALAEELARKNQHMSFEISKRTRNGIIKKILRQTFEESLTDNLEYNFSSNSNNLKKIRSDGFTFSIATRMGDVVVKYGSEGLKLQSFPPLDYHIIVKKTDTVGPIRALVENDVLIFEFRKMPNVDTSIQSTESPFMEYHMMSQIIIDAYGDFVRTKLLGDWRRDCYYLPAARSGIIQAQKVITNQLYEMAPYAGLERIQFPQFPGTVADFLKIINSIPEKDGPLADIEKEFEDRLIHGRIVSYRQNRSKSINYLYRFEDFSVPINMASSTVSELAPLFIIIKYYLKSSNIVIIEEPEAHLHPGNQVILAQLLARLVNRGVRVVITTHSSFLLEQLSNLIISSRLKNNSSFEELGLKKEYSIKLDDIAVFSFFYDPSIKGTKITEVCTNEEDGISQDDFLRIYDQLYNQTVKLRKIVETQDSV